MAADVAPFFAPQFFDDEGAPLAGGKVYTYKAGTTSPLATYFDANFTQNTNPIILDSAGRASIFIGTQALKFVIHDADDVLIRTIDGVTGPSGTAVGIQTVVPIVTNGVQTVFDLGVAAEVPQNCTVVFKPTTGDRFVFLTSEYTVDGTFLTFNTAPPAGVGEIRVGATRSIAAAGLSDGGVTTSKIQELAVTNAKLAENSVGTSKIQDGSITTPKLADLAVTTAKIANNSITPSKLAAANHAISASSVAFTTATTSESPVTNLSVTITTSGRPVLISLNSFEYTCFLQARGNVPAGTLVRYEAILTFYRGSTLVGEYRCAENLYNHSGVVLEIYGMMNPPGAFVDNTAPAGTHTYSVKLRKGLYSSSQASASLFHARLYVCEI